MSAASQKDHHQPGPSRGWTSFLPWLLVCLMMPCIAYLARLPHGNPTNPRLWLPVIVDTNGNPTILKETRQLEFWTPSVKTKDYLRPTAIQSNDNDHWQVLDSDDVVIRFGSVLHSNGAILGYRRMEVWGQGRTAFKPGWWWTMNVTTDYTAIDLAQAYRGYWKSPQSVFVEVMDNRGSQDK